MHSNRKNNNYDRSCSASNVVPIQSNSNIIMYFLPTSVGLTRIFAV